MKVWNVGMEECMYVGMEECMYVCMEERIYGGDEGMEE